MNPHDKFAKAVFQDKENVIDFIKTRLPAHLLKKLDLSTLKLDTNSYVDEKLKESFSDIVYTCDYKDREIKITLLFEHKSYSAAYIHFQLLRYMLNIWESRLKEKIEITPVIPILFYHGEETWKTRKLSDYFPDIDDALLEFIPDFNYLLTDLSEYTDEEIIDKLFDRAIIKTSFLIMKNIWNEEKLEKNLIDFLNISKFYYEEEKGLRFLETVIRYLFYGSGIAPEKIPEKIEQVSTQGGKIAMTAATQLMEIGELKGIEKGMEKGIKEGKIEDAQKMLNKGYDIQDISDITGLSIEEIQKFKPME